MSLQIFEASRLRPRGWRRGGQLFLFSPGAKPFRRRSEGESAAATWGSEVSVDVAGLWKPTEQLSSLLSRVDAAQVST